MVAAPMVGETGKAPAWAPGKVSFAGRFFSFSDMHVNPKPVQQPHPPVWIGGASDAALRRAARFAAQWQPTPLPLTELVERQTALHQACNQIGRLPIPTRMSFREFSTITGNAPSSGGPEEAQSIEKLEEKYRSVHHADEGERAVRLLYVEVVREVPEAASRARSRSAPRSRPCNRR